MCTTVPLIITISFKGWCSSAERRGRTGSHRGRTQAHVFPGSEICHHEEDLRTECESL